MKKRQADPARRVAFDALRAVHAKEAYANLILPQLLAQADLSGRDAAFATELLAGTCRLEGSYDQIIAAASGRKLGSLQPAVLDLLRLGAHQLLSMRVPSHAAVAATVNLAAATVGERVTGLTNAVLRKIAAKSWEEWIDELVAPQSALAARALRTAHPEWVVSALGELLDEAELEEALLANNTSPVTALAIRPGLSTVDELREAGAGVGQHSPFAASWTGNPGDLAAVRTGRAGVQDEGSQLVTLALTRAEAAPGWWLDLCAGPGGKSALLRGLAAEDGSQLLSSERLPHRADLVASALRGYPNRSVLVADGTNPAWRTGVFSRVLADVPCTGLGALRRRPESRWRRGVADVEELHPLQVGLLDSAIDAAAPGGVIGYVTCSPHQRETEDVVAEVLAARGESVRVIPAVELLPEVSDAARGPYLQLWPHRHGTDAMFAAYLRKNA